MHYNVQLSRTVTAVSPGVLDVLHCVLIDSPEALNVIKEQHIRTIISLIDKHGRDPKVGVTMMLGFTNAPLPPSLPPSLPAGRAVFTVCGQQNGCQIQPEPHLYCCWSCQVPGVLCSLCVGNNVAVRSNQNLIFIVVGLVRCWACCVHCVWATMWLSDPTRTSSLLLLVLLGAGRAVFTVCGQRCGCQIQPEPHLYCCWSCQVPGVLCSLCVGNNVAVRSNQNLIFIVVGLVRCWACCVHCVWATMWLSDPTRTSSLLLLVLLGAGRAVFTVCGQRCGCQIQPEPHL